MIIDSHAHYENRRFDLDRDTLLEALPSNGIEMVINVGCDLSSSYEVIELAKRYPHAYATVGVHPHEAKTLSEGGLQILSRLCTHEKVLALGEIGLDFHYQYSPRDVQRHWFKRQLELAAEINMPVVIHSRAADIEVFETIEKSQVRKGVIHCFPGDAELALKYVELGFYIGIGGVVTFDVTNSLQEAVAAIPLDKILLETDAPYLTPVPHRRRRNESKYLTYVADEIAKIKGISAETVCTQTSKNVRTLFNLN